MGKTVGIVGAGIIGRLMALELLRLGWQVSLYDEGGLEATHGCSYAGAGMLSPYSELEKSEPLIASLGLDSLELWPGIIEKLEAAGHTLFFQHAGSVVVAHPHDAQELASLSRRALDFGGEQPIERIGGARLKELEPGLDSGFSSGLYFANEGVVGTRALLPALGLYLQQAGVEMHLGQKVSALRPHHLQTQEGEASFDCVVDCRGLGGKEDQPEMRGVRGELVAVHAPEVKLKRPVRLMHPRYPLYVVPRPDSMYLIGATSIESNDRSPMTVRSALELLSAAYSLSTAFAEASIIELVVQCRPAFPDNHPRVVFQKGLWRVNGFYRHGYLIGPKLAQMGSAALDSGKIPADAGSIFREAG